MAFARELKDFISGFQAGHKLMSDAEYRKARIKLMGSQQTLTDAKVAEETNPENIRLRQQERQSRAALMSANANKATALSSPEQLDAIKQERLARAKYWSEGGARRQAVPEVFTGNVTPPASPIEDETIPGYAGGGTVKRQALSYEEGGMVTDDGGDEDLDTGGDDEYGDEAARDAIRDALTYGNQNVLNARAQAPMPQQAIPTQPGATAQPQPAQGSLVPGYLRGQGAIGNGVMQQVYDKIDPKRQMPEGRRNMAAYAAVYKWYMEKGDMRKAQAAVYGMLQQHRMNANHYNALAKAALQSGKLDAAAEFAARSYANIPSGKDLKFEMQGDKIVYSITDDKTGKVTKKGLMSPQQLGSAIMGWDPSKFDAEIAALAGERPRAGKGARAPREEKVRLSDRRAAKEAIDTELSATTGGETGKLKYEMTGNRDVIHNAASNIFRINNDIDEATAVTLAGKLVDPANSLDSMGFSGLRELEDGSREMTMRSGRPVRIPRNVWLDVMAARSSGWDKKEASDLQANIAKVDKEGTIAMQERRDAPKIEKRREQASALPGGRRSRQAIRENVAAMPEGLYRLPESEETEPPQSPFYGVP